MELSSETEKDIYSSFRSEGQHSMVYNSGYIRHVEPGYEQTTNNGELNTMGDSFEHVTSNPAYGDLSKTDTTEYNHLFSLPRTSKQIYSHLTFKKQTTSGKLCCLAVVATLALVLSIAAVLGTITAQALSSLHTQTQQEALEEQGKSCACTTAPPANSTRFPLELNLENKLNATLEELEVVKNMVTQLSSAQQQLQQEYLSLQSSMDTPIETPTADPRVAQLDSTVSQLLTSQNRLEQDQTTLKSNVTTLTNQISSPVDLYQSCYEETAECYLSPTMGRYWRQCSTGELPINTTGHYTLSMRCEHRSRRFGIFQESAYLRPNDSNQNVRCVCDTTYPKEDAPGHWVIPSDSDVDLFCKLTIIRCPIASTLYK